MGLRNIGSLSIILVVTGLLSACQNREDRSRGSVKPIPPAGNPSAPTPGAPVPTSNQDLIKKDNERRQAQKDQIIATNPNISKSPMLTKPRIDDVLTTSLQVRNNGGTLDNLKFVVVLRTSQEKAVALNFSTDKKMAALGNNQSLTAQDKSRKVSAEARCLKSCEDVLVRVRREHGEESAFVFKVSPERSGLGELAILPGLETDPNANRVFNLARVVELSFPLAQNIENAREAMKSSKAEIEMLLEAGDQVSSDGAVLGELNRGVGLLEFALSAADSALNEAYALTGMALKNFGDQIKVSQDQLSVIDQKLLPVSQNLASVVGIINQQSETGKVKPESQKQMTSLESDLRAAHEKVGLSREKLPLLIQLINSLGTK